MIISRFIPDNLYIRYKYKRVMHKTLNLKNPRTFNEKLQWLKLNDRNPLYTTLVDKYEVKSYISDKIGDRYVIPTLGIWNNFEEIDFDRLPEQFVLKCTHDSGSIVIVKNKKDLNIESIRKKFESSLKKNFYYMGREWPYKNVKPRILAEKLMTDESGTDLLENIYEIENKGREEELTDYKLMCFNGKVKCSFVCTDRFSKEGLRVTFFDTEWNILPFERHYPKSDKPIKQPVNYKKMISLAEKLSEGIPFVRVDFYEVTNMIYFGEMTFFPGSGMEEFTPEEWDIKLGDWIHLTKFKERE